MRSTSAAPSSVFAARPPSLPRHRARPGLFDDTLERRAVGDDDGQTDAHVLEELVWDGRVGVFVPQVWDDSHACLGKPPPHRLLFDPPRELDGTAEPQGDDEFPKLTLTYTRAHQHEMRLRLRGANASECADQDVDPSVGPEATGVRDRQGPFGSLPRRLDITVVHVAEDDHGL